MHRIDAPGATAQNRFTQGDAVQGIPATVVDDEWLNAVQEEVVTVIDEASIALNKSAHNQLFLAIQKMVQITATQLDEKRWPVGSFYFNKTDATDPGTFLPGSWTRVTSGFLYPQGAPDSGVAGSTGGETQHQLTSAEMPKHKHTGNTESAGAHNHSVAGVIPSPNVYDLWAGSNPSDYWGSKKTSTAGDHSHGFTTNDAGGDAAHNNMPPHLTVYIWERVS